jgi:hypothetical protein
VPKPLSFARSGQGLTLQNPKRSSTATAHNGSNLLQLMRDLFR